MSVFVKYYSYVFILHSGKLNHYIEYLSPLY